MIELVLTETDSNSVQTELINEITERCAILFATQFVRPDGVIRLLVREIVFPHDSDYSKRGKCDAQLRPEFVARITKVARRKNLSIVFVHSHLGKQPPLFSKTDSNGEVVLASFLAHRHPSLIHLALVISAGGMCARRLATNENVKVISIGQYRRVLFDANSQTTQDIGKFDRQIRAFGTYGQFALQQLRIAVVGLGGTGSLVAQQLVHLGVRDFILIDPDTLEESNLNRVVNATSRDIGQPKVKVAEKYIRTVATSAQIKVVQGDIVQKKIAEKLLSADIIFGCTDSHGSRAILQQISYQYLIPCIDSGTTISVNEEKISHIYGRVQLLSPGLACFTCGSLLNPEEVRRDMMSDFERKMDPYISGAREPAPAVISLNGTVVSLAVTMLLSLVSGIPVSARHLLYNALSSSLRNVHVNSHPNCYICSKAGSLARGNSWPLMARNE